MNPEDRDRALGLIDEHIARAQPGRFRPRGTSEDADLIAESINDLTDAVLAVAIGIRILASPIEETRAATMRVFDQDDEAGD